MPSLSRELFRKVFVVDEPRQAVFDPDAEGASHQASPDAAAPDDAGQAPPQSDLMTQIAAMLRKQDRLEALSNELRSQGDQTSSENLMRFFRSALSTLDGFERVMHLAEEHPPSPELQNWLASIAGIQLRITQLFERFGLRDVDPIGQKVDLNHHEVVEVLHTDSVPDETIVEVRQKGYVFEGRVLRDARVVVAKQ